MTTRASVSSGGVEGNGDSDQSSLSNTGRFVVFASDANNLVAGDLNGIQDVFVRDLLTGVTERVSVSSAGLEANGMSGQQTPWGNNAVSVSGDGRFVAFRSVATNLVPGDTNASTDIFLRDRQNGTTQCISVSTGGVPGNGGCGGVEISADGRYVLFESGASNLVPVDTNGQPDAFVRDLQSGTTELVSVSTGGAQGNSGGVSFTISSDGRYVSFFSGSTNLVPSDNNGHSDVFVRDRQTGTTERVSVDSSGAEANSFSHRGAISADGRYVAFDSNASNLVVGDTNSTQDVFVRDRQAGTTERVSVDSAGVGGASLSYMPSISDDGRYVTFWSASNNLVAGDLGGWEDIFVRDRQNNTTELVTVDSNEVQANGHSNRPTISGDGRWIAFESLGTNLVPGDANGFSDVFVRERGGGTEQESEGEGGAPSNGDSLDVAMSTDGRYVAFESDASNLVAGDTNGSRDIFVKDREALTTTRVSVDSVGTQGNGGSFNPTITADGRYVAFESVSTNLVAGDTNAASDVFVHDRLTSATARASVTTAGVQANGSSTNASFAAGGSAVAFESAATNLVTGDTNGALDVFVRDFVGGATTRASVASAGTQGNGNSVNASISANGLLVAFDSTATNLVAGDTNGSSDVFVRDRSAPTTTRVSLDSSGVQGTGGSTRPSISSDGRFVAFASAANNFVGGDSNLTVDVFVRDRQLNTITRVSVANDGSQGLMWSGDPSISADGRYVAFASDANNLVAGDANATTDVFVHDRIFASTRRLSVDSSGVEGTGTSLAPAISADGRHVGFESDASNLVIGDTNGFIDTFVRDSGVASAFEVFCPGDGTVAPCPCGNSGTSGRGCQNSGSTGGALLTVTGVASLSSDTVQFTSSGERPTSLSIFLQGSTTIAPINYGDGLRCTGGNLKRLYTKTAIGGVVVAPTTGELSISARSAQLNAEIPLGATRPYQVYYRDGAAAFCPDPPGSTFNVSNGFLVAWGG